MPSLGPLELLYKPVEGIPSGGCHAHVHLPDPAAPSGPRPVAIAIHGGAWVKGCSLDAPASQIAYLVRKGVVVVSIQYRLAPHVDMDAMREDCLDAYRWVLNDLQGSIGGETELDVSRVGVLGWSAGASLTIYLAHDALQAGLPPLKALIATYIPADFSPWSSEAPPDVQKMTDDLAKTLKEQDPCAVSAPFEKRDAEGREIPPTILDNRAKWLAPVKKARNLRRYILPADRDPTAYQVPMQCVNGSYPPSGFAIAAADEGIPPTHSYDMRDKLKGMGVEVDYWVAEGAPHGFAEFIEEGGRWWDDCVRPSLDWVVEKLGG